MSTHTPIVVIHLALLCAMLLIAALGHKKAVGAVCWWIGFLSSALFSIGLVGLLVVLAFSPGFISPLAFAGGYGLALLGYAALTALFWAFKPVQRTNPLRLVLVALGFCVLTATWFYTPQILSRSLVVTVAMHDGTPISGATVSFKLERSDVEKSEITSSDGQVVIPLPYMATLEGQVSAAGFGNQSIYIAPNHRTSGAGFTIIQKPETRFLGGLPPLGGMFLYSTPAVARLRMDVYLQRIGEGFPLPHKAISNLADHLREAQKVAVARGAAYPVVLDSGDIFNPEMKAQSPDAYRQVSKIIDAYDARGPLRNYAADYWNYFLLDNSEYDAQRKRIEEIADTNPDRVINTVILGGLLGEDVRGLSASEGLAKISRRLENDRRRLKEVTTLSK